MNTPKLCHHLPQTPCLFSLITGETHGDGSKPEPTQAPFQNEVNVLRMGKLCLFCASRVIRQEMVNEGEGELMLAVHKQ